MILGKKLDRESSNQVKSYGSEETASFRAGIWPGFTESSSLLVLGQDRDALINSASYWLDSTGRNWEKLHQTWLKWGIRWNRFVLGLGKTGFGQQALHLLKA